MQGRPRDTGLEKRLLSAAWSLLVEQGYDKLALSRVATQAEAHRTDVYRRWTTKARLVTDVVAEFLPPVSDAQPGAARAGSGPGPHRGDRRTAGRTAAATSIPSTGPSNGSSTKSPTPVREAIVDVLDDLIEEPPSI